MCQLLGMNSHLPASLTLSFTGFSQRGGCTDHHADGWGIAFFESEANTPDQPGKGIRYFVDKEGASTSPIAKMLRTYPIKSHNVVAHVRKATVGAIALENCHPFVRELWGRYWVFAHNGDLNRSRAHAHPERAGAANRQTWHIQLFVEQRPSLVGQREHQTVLRRTPAPLYRGAPQGQRCQCRFGGAEQPARPAGDCGHRALDHQ